jgi:hypothetical protein
MLKYIIEFEKGVYFCDIEGDPGRTLKIENAKVFVRKQDAQRTLLKAKHDYPQRKFLKACVRLFSIKCENCFDSNGQNIGNMYQCEKSGRTVS